MAWVDWTWDPDKNRENIRKHGFDFPTAMLVFYDLDSDMQEDIYPYEQRWRTIGTVEGRIIVVIHTWPTQGGEPGRIISARKPTPYERRRYQEEYGQIN